MSDTTSAAPAAPTPSTPAAAPAPQPNQPAAQGATVTPLRTHHSAAQPRSEAGQFAGPPAPAPAATQAPKSWKLGDREVTDPDELYALAAERVVDHDAYQRTQQELHRLRQEAERWKDPRQALTPEQIDQLAMERLQEALAQEEEKKLPPEVQQARRELREAQRLKREIEQERQAQQAQQQAAQRQQLQQQAVAEVRSVVSLLGEQETPEVTRDVVAELKAAAKAGKSYPPQVIAHRLRQRWERESIARVSRMGPQRLLSDKGFLEALNKVEDPAVLQALAPLIEKGRLMAMQAMQGAAPGGAQPPAPPAPVLAQGQEPRTTREWQAWFQAGNKPATPQQMAKRNELLNLGLL